MSVTIAPAATMAPLDCHPPAGAPQGGQPERAGARCDHGPAPARMTAFDHDSGASPCPLAPKITRQTANATARGRLISSDRGKGPESFLCVAKRPTGEPTFPGRPRGRPGSGPE